MIPYIPHTDADRRAMLKAIGVDSIDQLFSSVPKDLLQKSEHVLHAMAEEDVLSLLASFSGMNRVGTSFLGMGSYDRIIPSAVTELASLPAFVSAYTPYQPEISQGLLQAIYEYQTMICQLTGMDVSNASLYDGHTASVEAAEMMLRGKRGSSVILVSDTVHPFTLQVLKTWALGTDYTVIPVAECNRLTDCARIGELLDHTVGGVMVQSPNRYGFIEDYTGLAEQVHRHKAQLTISSDPLSLVLQQSQAEWGADIAIGDTQPLGLPSAFGGPSCGYISVKEALLRRLPGRIVGETVDTEGRRAFVLTLQAREQHIRRERAASNICSNQALAALTTTIHVSLIGYAGMCEAAQQSYDKAHYLADQLCALPHIRIGGTGPFWTEFPLLFDKRSHMEALLQRLEAEGIHGGVRLGELTGRPSDETTLVVAVTERRKRSELDQYVDCAREVLV
mgnify:CR=1 FL=1